MIFFLKEKTETTLEAASPGRKTRRSSGTPDRSVSTLRASPIPLTCPEQEVTPHPPVNKSGNLFIYLFIHLFIYSFIFFISILFFVHVFKYFTLFLIYPPCEWVFAFITFSFTINTNYLYIDVEFWYFQSILY